MGSFAKKTMRRILGAKSSLLIFVVIFAVFLLSSFDVCWFPGEAADKGFVFASNWTEHLHSSEEFTVYYQTAAFYEGRNWLTESTLPVYSVDSIMIGNHSYALAEPVTAALLLPFYAFSRIFSATDFLVRSVMIGMIFYTCLSAILARKISLQLNQGPITANLTALLFAFTTMAFSYSRLLYPQPIVTLLMLFTIVFLLSYKDHPNSKNLFLSALFFGLTVFSFNAFIITAPFFLCYLFKTGIIKKGRDLYSLVLGVFPSLILFLVWNLSVTGNPILTARQLVHSSISFQILYTTTNGTWLNIEGLMGSLFSPIGIFFVSPILLAAFATYSSFKLNAKNETMLFASIIIVFWLFISLINLGGAAERDFWVGGWANIARYMHVPSTLLVIFASAIFARTYQTRNIIAAFTVSLATLISFLANLSYGIRHDFMVGLLKDFPSTSLIVWPYQMGSAEVGILSLAIFLVSLAYPAYLFKDKHNN